MARNSNILNILSTHSFSGKNYDDLILTLKELRYILTRNHYFFQKLKNRGIDKQKMHPKLIQSMHYRKADFLRERIDPGEKYKKGNWYQKPEGL